ncbi:heptaprenyl diphosphate synthase [Eubacterium sulci ATCC 35585]|nr:heptaprenyl diphosphate synthase [Eubacterium sulci ATCC 35585]MBF1138316.1 Gx transporter family protein [[Eubacterium] sulci]EUC78246.1 heptaprenyl diphosphate synthase component I [Eubacterium sulci ATCC 35585]MBF1142032.1 Gx transporter family protein [[Eubacterium] sulci]MBF1147449.1 Gx transporter family protein [[Eubacterium] sulci]
MSSHNKMSSRAHSRSSRIATTALLAALALIFSYVEAIIPMPIAVPGVKLGIANLAVLIALYRFDFRYALSINLIRIIVSGLLFNGLFGALYAMSGGVLSLIVMWLLKKTNLFSIVGVSMAGGVAHNMGQILVASLLVSDLRMFMYLPVLMFSGIISGIIIGVIAYYVQRSLNANKGASQI